MKTYSLKHLLLTGLVMSFPMLSLSMSQASEQALTAMEIMVKVDARDEGDTSVADSAMVLIDKRGRKRTRQLKQYSKKYPVGTKYMAIFLTPADLKDTVYINYDWDTSERDDDSWLYLPALQKNKRIAADDRSGSFLGSDFSYADLSGFELAWYDYELLSESEVVNGHDCWLIEYRAKDKYRDKVTASTQDLKTQTWIRKDNFVQVKSKIWKVRAGRIKYYSASDIEKIDGVWTVKKMQMITVKNGKKEHASILKIHNVNYNSFLSDELFKSENMQRAALIN
ncbi:outer membrane lipoprotein-sorting protein [Shewanella violacea]|nr:outer membrane lipoprotein-sorting protein [Shewanella violacea]